MKTKDLLFYLLVILILILIVYLIYFTTTSGSKCMSNPLVYGVNKYDSGNGDFMCACSSVHSNEIILFVTKDNMSLLDSYR